MPRRGLDGLTVGRLDLVALEDAAVQVGHLAQQAARRGRALLRPPGKPLEEQRAEEVGVVAVRRGALAGRQPRPQVVRIAVQKAFLLDEVDEHQPVEHHRGVPALQAFIGDAVEELEEGGVLGLEPLVEAFGDPLHVEAGAHPFGDLNDAADSLLLPRC